MNDRKVWGAFLLLALVWGTSFLFIKIAVQTLEPVTLVASRLTIGLIGLWALVRWYGLSVPREARFWRRVFLTGTLSMTIPFALITWAESGENGLDSGLVAVLNSVVPLFTIIIAGVILRLEEITAGKIVGLVVGFAGVLLLFSRDIGGGSGRFLPLMGVIGATLCYAIATIYAQRFLRGYTPLIISFGQLLAGTLLSWLLALLIDDFSGQTLPLPTIGALLWLGLLGSSLAYILFFFILQNWGSTRSTLVTYVVPVVGVAVGVIFLDETLDWRIIAGGLLILSGVGVVNWRPGRRRKAAALSATD